MGRVGNNLSSLACTFTGNVHSIYMIHQHRSHAHMSLGVVLKAHHTNKYTQMVPPQSSPTLNYKDTSTSGKEHPIGVFESLYSS